MTSFDGDGGVPLSNAWWEHPAQLSEASKILQRNVFFFLLFFGGGGMLRWRIRIRDNRAELMMVFGKFLLVVCLFFPSFILHPFYRHRRKLGVLYTFVRRPPPSSSSSWDGDDDVWRHCCSYMLAGSQMRCLGTGATDPHHSSLPTRVAHVS